MKSVGLIVISVLCTCFCTYTCAAQGAIGEITPWNGSNELTWKDYNVLEREPNGSIAACSKISITYVPVVKNDSIDIYVYCYLNRSGSYVYKAHENDNTLEHERGHFNLAEVYARTLRKEILEGSFTLNSFQRYLGKYYRNIKREWKKEDRLYEEDTGVESGDTAKQKEWNTKIEEQLKQLNTYNISHILIKVKK